jgi:urease accessory protein
MALSAIGRAGELRLTFARHQQQTILVENYARPPLQVMRAIPDSAGCLCVYLLSPSGGVLQGDHYTIQLSAQADTHALFTTPSATRIYRMPTGSAEQHIQITLDENAICEFVPDANILFAEADFYQTMDVTLKSGALMVIQDVVMPGRLARGECFAFRRYRSHLRVRDEQGWLLYDANHIEPATQDVQRLGIVDGFTCWGSLYLVGDLEQRGIHVEQFCQTYAEGLSGSTHQGGISLLPRNGIAVRVLSQRLETIYALFTELRLAWRGCLGLTSDALRK